MTLAPGTRLGPYEILAPLGAGGMGEVYRARDSRLERDVAIKVLPEHLSQNPEAMARFEREVKAVAALSHPNILAIHDFGTDRGLSYAVMELLEGETLRSRIARSHLPWRKAVEIATALAEGLSAAHSKGIIHRDLKPENVFLTSDGRVKILDFGLARFTPVTSSQDPSLAPTETDPGHIRGTVGYISPEQLRRISAEAPSDLFSLGCVIYEMVTGERAFARPSTAETIAAILREDPPQAADAGRQIPPELDRIITRCLEKNPEARFQSAQDLAFALKEVGTRGDVFPPVERRPPFRPRHWIAAAAALLALGILYLLIGLRGVPRSGIDSLAVLPFTNVSGDPDVEYLSEGITEGIINSLSQLPALRVMARTTVFRYKGRETEHQKIGRDLNVAALLTGKVVQRGQVVIIQADLVDAGSGRQLWGQQYTRRLSDIFAVQQEIVKEISERLRLRLTGEEQERLAKHYTESADAYRLYLQGRYYWNKRTEEGLQKGIEYFEQAIRKDPGYALAYAGLADCYNLRSMYGTFPPREAFPKAKAAALEALRIDDKLSEAHASLALVKYEFDWDWAGAEQEFRRALQLNPGYATAHHWYGFYLAALGRQQEALREIRRAQELDPFSLIIRAALARILYSARHYDQAIAQCRKTFELDPNFVQAHLVLGDIHVKKGKYQDAIAAFEKAMTLAGGTPETTPELVHAYAVSGRRREALEILDKLQTRSSPYDVAVVYTGLGDKDRAFEWLERAYSERSENLVYLRVDPMLDGLRSDRRFADLLRRMGLQP